MRYRDSSSRLVPFCRQSWRVPAVLLLLLFFGTVAWGIHLVRDHRNQLSLGHQDGSVAMAGSASQGDVVAQSVAMAQPDPNPLRVTVVNISGISQASGNGVSPYVSAGSGVLVNPKGYVITAQHLIQNLREIQVRVSTPFGPRQYPAKTVKVVPQHDLALIKIISQDPFPYAALSQSPLPQVGELVQAWGDPYGTDAVERVGVVESMDLTSPVAVADLSLTHLMKTNSIFHWAQSGGPLVNQHGHLIGINLAVQNPDGSIQGFAVPAHVLVTHFQEVVTFAHKMVPSTGAAALVQPAVADSAVADVPVVSPRPSRTADQWWQRAQGILNLGSLGKHVALDPTAGTLPTKTAAPVLNDPAHSPSWRIFGYSAGNFFGLLLLGFVSGISGGMMTMGGGIIKVTGLLWFFGYGLLLVRPVAYITNIFMYGAAVLRYHRHGLLHFEFCKPLIPWAMAGMVAGYFLGNIMSKMLIQWLLGGFALLLGIKMLVEIAETRRKPSELDEEIRMSKQKETGVLVWLQRYFGTQMDESVPVPAWRYPATRHGVLGLPMGLVSGILGITGGVIEVPLQRYIARMPLRNAIANSATLVFFSSLVGSVVALWHGVKSGSFDLETPITMALILTPGAFLGGMVGAWLTVVIPLNMLRWIYAALMFVIAVRMFLP
ncbi:magnetosome protein MamO [Candidatus Magnetaquicoccus inordinatus]|uniref:magnetosome protein MamO n=1 Tax=Candidatus Magnetaquicoccus inordinatus TaxID=2496818 RepID=UPI00102CCB9F|nr:magnetosome protein MamO [Candidatus Magnetaquicoccus inordinatus]